MHLHSDPFSCSAGDMLLAALFDLGLEMQALCSGLGGLSEDAFDLSAEKVVEHGISATRVTVHDRSGERAPHRVLKDLLRALEQCDLPAQVKSQAEDVFSLLARAEGAVHRKSSEEVHFHEISGIDTFVDVVGTCLGLSLLDVTRITCSPVTVGSGTIECAHGTLPVPAPATLEILTTSAIPFAQIDTGQELLTPTGAALLAVIVDAFVPCPSLLARGTGYGAGSRQVAGRPNLVRAILGSGATDDASTDTVIEYTAVVDDMTAEELAHAVEQCFAVQALDAYTTPATMKKGRAGMELTVLCHPAESRAVLDALFQHTTTFGLRVQQKLRQILQREIITVTVRGHAIRIKRGSRSGTVMTVQPEFEDCKVAAEAMGESLDTVFQLARNAARP